MTSFRSLVCTARALMLAHPLPLAAAAVAMSLCGLSACTSSSGLTASNERMWYYRIDNLTASTAPATQPGMAAEPTTEPGMATTVPMPSTQPSAADQP